MSHKSFQEWTDFTSHPEQAVLKLIGPEKRGKTFLCYRIISHLMNNERLSDHPSGALNQFSNATPTVTSIAYHYFGKDDEKNETSIQDAVAAIIWQLVQSDLPYRQFIANHCSTSGHPIPKNDLLALLEPRKTSRFLIILDGIDHCADKTAGKLQAFLANLTSQADKSRRVRLLLSGNGQSLDCVKNFGSTVDLTLVQEIQGDIELFANRILYGEAHPLRDQSRQHLRAPNSQEKSSNGLETSDDIVKNVLLPTRIRNYDFINFLLGKINNGVWSSERLRALAERLSKGGKFALVEYRIEHANKKLDVDQIHDLNEIIPWVTPLSSGYPTVEMIEEILALSHGGSRMVISTRNYIEEKFDGLLYVVSYPATLVAGEAISGFFCERYGITEERTVSESSESSNIDRKTENELHPSEILMTKNLLKTVCGDQLFQKFGFDQFFQDKEDPLQRGIYFNPILGHIKIITTCLNAACGSERDDYQNLCLYAGSSLPRHLSQIHPQMLSNSQVSAMADVMPLLARFLGDSQVIKRWFKPVNLEHVYQRWFCVGDNRDFISRWFNDPRIARHSDVQKFRKEVRDPSQSNSYLVEPTRAAAWMWLQTTGPKNPEREMAFTWVRSFLNEEKTSDESTSVPRPSISIIKNAESWAQQALSAERSLHMPTWDIHMASTFEKFDHYREAAERYEMIMSRTRALWAISEIAQNYAKCVKNTDGDYLRALRTLEPVLEYYQHQSKKLEGDDKYDWLDTLFDMSQVYHDAGNTSEAVRLCENALELVPQSSRFKANLVRWMFASGRYAEMTSTLASMTPDGLVKIFVGRSMDFVRQVAIAASKDKSTNFIEVCRQALQAHGKLDSSAVYLSHCYALLLSWDTQSYDSRNRAMAKWQEILQVSPDYNDSSSRYLYGDVGSQLAACYVQVAVERGQTKMSIEEIVPYFDTRKRDKLDSLFEQESIFLARFYHLTNRDDFARCVLYPKMILTCGLLGDDNVENDWMGYMLLGQMFTCLDRDEDAIAAWSLQYRYRGVGLKFCRFSDRCSGFCGIEWDNNLRSDVHKCKDCHDVNFDRDCWKKVREGTLGWSQCGKGHNFLRIPKWDEAAEERFKGGRILVGHRDLDIKKWTKDELDRWESQVTGEMLVAFCSEIGYSIF
ncbi:hypothetical protein HDK90DRAFT_233335 [Phyllosticta capitalensis]|uniref:Nephrocystin 3-like N-terminal domain-containing protein n=1 Tax=Phyllosticta capitalensis TaxID=121624 RepID=A0ABR1YUI9_9PEZI